MTKIGYAIIKWCARWSSVLLIALVAICVAVFEPYDNGPPIRSDGAGYHIWTYAILKGDVTFSWYEGNPIDVGLHQPDPAVKRYTSKYPPGVALIRLPVMAFVSDPEQTGLPYSEPEHWACLGLGAAALVVAVALGLDSCSRLGVPRCWANASILMLTFGTGLFHYATYDASFSHIYSALLVAGLVWLAVRAVESQRPIPIVPVVFLTTGLFLVRTTNIFLVGYWAVACAVWAVGRARQSPGFRFRAIGAAALGLALGIGTTVALNYAMFNRLTIYTYTGESFVWDDPQMLNVLWDDRHGVFRLYPILGVAILAGLIAWRSRGMAIGLILLIGAYVALYGHWWAWQLACGFGHRGFVELVPFAFPVLAVALGSLPRYVAWPVAIFGGVTTIYATVQMWQYWQNAPYLPLASFLP